MPHTAAYSDNRILEMMRRQGLRPSAQRIAVLSFVANCRTHPSAEEIYNKLCDTFPSLSRTTVYNSLHALTDASLLRELEIESGNMRYDLKPQPAHGHFICRKCGRIFDTPLPHNLADPITPGFCIDCVEIIYRGLCDECNNQ